MNTISIIKPDDWHLHLRQGQILEAVLPATINSFRRAIVMPNLLPPVTSVESAMSYRQDILNACPDGEAFEPLMVLYLTDQTTPVDVKAAADNPYIHAYKYYPANATTNSASGVTHLPGLMPTLEAMAACQLPLLVHGEVVDPKVDVFDREEVFIETILSPLLLALPELRVVFEHLTTQQGVAFVTESSDNVAATLTAHHLLLNRNDMFDKGLRPHHYCLPVLKREVHRKALVTAATSGSPKFFLGTDSAPHDREEKESSCGCAGMYSSPVALALYTQIFEQCDALDRLEGFASLYGPEFYGLPVNTEKVTLKKEDWDVPMEITAGAGVIVPLCAGETLRWQQV